MGEIPYIEFHRSFLGNEFYLYKSGNSVDKWEVYATYLAGRISWRELQGNRGWIRHRIKIGWINRVVEF